MTITRCGMWLVLCGLAWGVAGAPARGEAVPADRLAPPGALLLAVVEDFTQLQARARNTSWFALYEDPAMQRVVASVEKQVRERLQEALREAWRELQIEGEPALPLPTGQVGLALRMVPVTAEVPQWDYDPATGTVTQVGTRQMTSPEPVVLFWADMGDNAPLLRSIERGLTDLAVRERGRLRREEIAGREAVVVIPPEDKRDIFIAWAWTGNRISIAIHPVSDDRALQVLRNHLLQASDPDRPSLADDELVAAAIRRTGRGDVWAVADVRQLLQQVVLGQPEEERRRLAAYLGAMGLGELTTLSMSARVAPGGDQDLHVHAFLGVRGQMRGIPAIIAGTNRPTHGLGRLVPADVALFLAANHDFDRMFNQTIEMLSAALGMNPTMMINMMMQETAQDGRPPVDLQRDVIAQLTAPILLTVRTRSAAAEPDVETDVLLRIGVRDAQILDHAIGRIHALADADRTMRRQLRDVTLYLMDDPDASSEEERTAIAIVGDQALLGDTRLVEQAIRDMGRDVPTLDTHPLYRHTARLLPPQASIVGYTNDQLLNESRWDSLRQTDRSTLTEMEHMLQAALPVPSGVLNTLEIDLTELPPFEQVRRHFGTGILWLTPTDNGLEAHLYQVKPLPE